MVVVLSVGVPAFNRVGVEQRNVGRLVRALHQVFDSRLGGERRLVVVLLPALDSSHAYSPVQVEVLHHVGVPLLAKALGSISFHPLWRCKNLWQHTLCIVSGLNLGQLEWLLLAERVAFKLANELHVHVPAQHLLVRTQRLLSSVPIQAAFELDLAEIL